MEQGDPRGELIAVQLALEDRPKDPALVMRESELLDEHRKLWLGIDMGIGLIGRELVVEWKRGFFRRVEMRTEYESTCSFAYETAVELPCMALVEDVAVGVGCSYNGTGDDEVDILKALGKHPLPTVCSLALTSFEFELSWTHVGDLSLARLEQFPKLTALSIMAGRMTLGAIALPKLRRLSLVTGGMPAHVLASIAAASWPVLDDLEVYFGTDNYGGTCTLADAEPLLDGAVVPAVTRLGLCNAEFGDELAIAVARSKILPRLRRLDLSLGTMGPAGAQAILDAAERFAHLDQLSLDDNYLPSELVAELVRRLPRVTATGQKIEDEYGRFVSVSE